MRKTNKNIFIEGFKDPTPLSSLNDVLFSDIKGDGDHKLILFDKDTSNLIVYKGISRAVQKKLQLVNASHMISFYDEDARTPQPCIAIGAENAIYILRNLQESFRLKIPDLVPQPEEQTAWSSHHSDIQTLTKQLLKIQQTKRLTEYGKYFIGASTKQRKQELIKIAFEDGIVEKDSISCLGTIRQREGVFVHNIMACTELKQLHILDNFGHLILLSFNLGFVGFQVFGEGQFLTNYRVVVVGRQQIVAVIENGNIVEKFPLPSRARSCSFDYPLLYVLTTNRTIISYDISDKHIKKLSFILPVQAIQIQAIRTRAFKALIVGCERQIRIYNQSLLICKFQLEHSLRCFKFGTSTRQQNCLALVYQQDGLEVRIMNRQFNHNFKYQKGDIQKQEEEAFPIPTVTSLFASQLKPSEDDAALHKQFQKDMKIMRWRTLTEQLRSLGTTNKKLNINSSILGIGPHFVLKLQIQNIGQQPLFDIKLCLNFDSKIYQLQEYQSTLTMVIPNFSYPINIHCKNISQTGQPANIFIAMSGPKVQPFSILIAMPQSEPQL